MLFVLAMAWAACEGPRPTGEGASMPTSASAPAPARGDEVTLSGRVTAAFGNHIFAVGSGAERVIVVTGTPAAVSVGRDVDVTGQVRTFRRAELEAELGVDLGPAANQLENLSCLVASAARVR